MVWPSPSRSFVCLLGLFCCLACGEGPSPPAAAPTLSPPVEAAGSPWANVAPARVEEVLSGDGRSYLRIRESVYEFWVSVPAQTFQVGDLLLLGKGPLQTQVRSEALGRTFDVLTQIEAVSRLSPEESERHFGISPVEGGISIAQLYAERAGLAGKPLKVRGRITKISRGIFGKDWMHIQDGTRGSGEGQDELTANTEHCPAEVGDVVVVEGPLTIDLDLGFGYFYAAILENAKVTPEGAPRSDTQPKGALLPSAPLAVADSPPPAATDLGLKPTTAAPPSGPPAPTRSLYGLRLGSAADPEISAWLAERGLNCKAAPAPARTTFQYRCAGPLPPKTLPDRKIAGQLSEILLARLENGPLHHFSSQRRYSLPLDVLADYHSALDSLTTVLGPPEKENRVTDPARLNAKALRIASRWRFADLEVVLSIFRGAGDYFAVNEIWTVPGAEALAKDRGGGAHGGGSRGRPVGWSPHVLADG